MHKVYLLIRRNKQSGPYTLEELLQLGLQPLDLIWVEGKSAAWSYPSEISSLQPYLKQENEPGKESEPAPAATPTPKQAAHDPYMPSNPEKGSPKKMPAPKLVYVSHPKNKSQEPTRAKENVPPVNIEQKAEELKRRAENYAEQKKAVPEGENIQTKYSKPLNEIEEEFATWTYKQKSKTQKQLPVKTLLSIGAGVLLLAGTYGLARYAFHTSKSPAPKDTVTNHDQNAELTTEKLILQTPPSAEALVERKQDVRPQPDNRDNHTVENRPDNRDNYNVENRADNRDNYNVENPGNKRDKVKPEIPKVQNNQVVAIATKKAGPAAEQKSKTKAPAVAEPVQKEEKKAAESTVTNTSKPVAAPREQEPVATASQKRKTFNERVDEFITQFRRKKPEEKQVEETATEEAQTTPPNTGNAERKARRREDEQPVAASPEPANLEEFVEVSSNQSSENWMLGIHGLKLTVSNRSSVPVKKAAVEIRYLNNLNEVLDKKVLYVTNIPAKKSITLLAPDHRLAERLESRVLSAEGN